MLARIARRTRLIRGATNELMRSKADLLRQTSVETAKANQRAVIDIATDRKSVV